MKLKDLSLKNGKKELPLVPLRELVVFPHMVVPFFAGRAETISAIEAAMGNDRMVFLACQRRDIEAPTEDDVFEAGSISKILQMLKLPDGTLRVLAEGMERGKVVRFLKKKEYHRVQVEPIIDAREVGKESVPLMAAARDAFRRYTKHQKKIGPEILAAVEKAEYPDKLVDLICANVQIAPEKKVEIIEKDHPNERLELLAVTLEAENEMLELQNKINSRVKQRLEKNQREYFLNEQLKQINKELGKEDDDGSGSKELRKRIEAREMPTEVWEKADKELARLARLQPMSPESGVLRTYLEWIADLPWSEASEDNHDIDLAQKILDEDHYDLKRAKERVLDFLAVRQLQGKGKGPIICFVGPPGTGKTSLGRSVARALGRKFVRISLGGIRDEAEIRGHRKTYVGALPGKIIQSMKKAQAVNPVFLLDEIDKMSSDFRGDPASALLEVLDPEQNGTFVDHYLEVPYDLSRVMFITTANSVHTIPLPLRDRMEVIEIPGYTDYEKVRIAKDFIIPKQLKENGLPSDSISFRKEALTTIIRNYTMESGVRNLEREIASIIRKTAREGLSKGVLLPRLQKPDDDTEPKEALQQSETKAFSAIITPKTVERYLGVPRFENDLLYRNGRPGLINGLAWTELGGKLLPVEVALLPGDGKLILTGNLGDVMKESARIALSFISSCAHEFGVEPSALKEQDIHVHVPQGAIPKDGPSAGITITTAILSALTGRIVERHIAMTGEITLTGRILAIGGLKEKSLAARRNGMTTILLPEDNRKDGGELPREVKSKIELVYVATIGDALRFLFPND
ncbi:endopeptidase La [Sediminispirochaeta bajacaliforniensis]|uniref:endopeptidase La n=1 Tax=Sediminispirochaeta bajacaliforniensis TaxID=148 RepID=UPI00036515F1|nr:endopeptidase La [Sediminispirochaeta bajacaliforniensis]